jgi:hypothetical protein
MLPTPGWLKNGGSFKNIVIVVSLKGTIGHEYQFGCNYVQYL